MSKKLVIGATAAVLLFAVLAIGIVTVDWDDFTSSDVPVEQPVFPDGHGETIWDGDGELKENSLSYTIFEKYGIVLVPLAILMFGAMVGGVCIAREEVEKDDSD